MEGNYDNYRYYINKQFYKDKHLFYFNLSQKVNLWISPNYSEIFCKTFIIKK